MKIGYGKGATEYGPGVQIDLTGDDVALAIDAWVVAQGAYVRGPRTTTVNGKLCASGSVYVDPSGCVIWGGKSFSGRGVKKPAKPAGGGGNHELRALLQPGVWPGWWPMDSRGV